MTNWDEWQRIEWARRARTLLSFPLSADLGPDWAAPSYSPIQDPCIKMGGSANTQALEINDCFSLIREPNDCEVRGTIARTFD